MQGKRWLKYYESSEGVQEDFISTIMAMVEVQLPNSYEEDDLFTSLDLPYDTWQLDKILILLKEYLSSIDDTTAAKKP